MSIAPPIRVLLVDDHRLVLWGLGKLLESAAPHIQLVDFATSPVQALAAVQQHKPDVVLLDLDLGGRSSVDVVPQIASQAAVLIVTGLTDATVHQRAMVAGARGIVLKSEPAEVILKAIQCVHSGEPWLDRASMGRLLDTLAAKRQGEPELGLTNSERKVVAAVVENKSAPNKVIAAKLDISEHTLRNHLATIYGKLGINRRIDLVFHAMKQGLSS